MKRLLLIFGFLFLLNVPSHAEMLLLNSGDIIEGDILTMTNEEITIDTGKDKPEVYKVSEIESVDGNPVYIVGQQSAPAVDPTPVKTKSSLDQFAPGNTSNIDLSLQQILIYAVIAYILWSIPLSILGNRYEAGTGWMAWVPFANIVLMFRIADIPLWWMACIFIPAFGNPILTLVYFLAVLVFYIIFGIRVAQLTNHPTWIGAMIGIPNIISIFTTPLLGFMVGTLLTSAISISAFWYLAFAKGPNIDDEEPTNDPPDSV